MTMHGISSTSSPIHRQIQTIHQADTDVLITKYNELVEEFQALKAENKEYRNENKNKLCVIENSIKDLEKLLKNSIEESKKNVDSASKQRKGHISITFPLTCASLIRYEGLGRTLGDDEEGYVKGEQLLFEFNIKLPRKFSVHIHGYSGVPSSIRHEKLFTYKVYVGKLGEERRHEKEFALSCYGFKYSHAEFETKEEEYNNIITIAMPKLERENLYWNGGHAILHLHSLKIISREEEVF